MQDDSCRLGGPSVFPDPLLPIGHYRLTFRARETWRLPPFAGDMWRRAFNSAAHGLALRDDRLGGAGTVAGYLFESAPGPWALKMRRYKAVPTPLIIRPHDFGPRLVRPDDAVGVDIILVGHANRLLGALVQAAQAAAQKGLGLKESRGRAVLSALHAVDLESAETCPLPPTAEMSGTPEGRVPTPPAAPAPARVMVHLITPLRIRNADKTDGAAGRQVPDESDGERGARKDDYIEDPRHLDARAFLMTLVRRISMLSYFHTDHPLDIDPVALALKRIALAASINVGNVTLEHLTRPETRTTPAEPKNGLVGKLDIGFVGENPFWPYLWLARWVGIGHFANVGLGAIDVEAGT